MSLRRLEDLLRRLDEETSWVRAAAEVRARFEALLVAAQGQGE